MLIFNTIVLICATAGDDMEMPVFEPHDFNNDTILPFRFHLDRIGGRKPTCIPNWHQSLEVLYFIEGEGQVICNSQPTDVRAGDIFVVNAYHIHQVVARTPAICYYCLLIGSTFGKENAIAFDACRLRSRIADPHTVEAYRRVVAAYQDQGRFHAAVIRRAVLDLLIYLGENHLEGPEAEFPEGRSRILTNVMTAINYIRTHYADHITVEDIAREVRLSRYHLSRIFRETTQYPIVTFITLIRCQQARNLLAATLLPVTEIAYACGYRNLSYFTRSYKTVMGELPSETRRAAESALTAADRPAK